MVGPATGLAGSRAALLAMGVLGAVWLSSSCRQVAGLDGDFVDTSSSGSTASGGGVGGAGGGAGATGGAGGAADVCSTCAADKFCDPSQGCGDCLEASHCTDANKPACVDGKCRECATAADCPTSGDVCYSDLKCGSECTGDGDCPDLCDTDAGVCVQCLTVADCSDQLCHPTQLRCVDCVADSDCPAEASRCQHHDHKCKECLIDTDCASGEICDKQSCHAA